MTDALWRGEPPAKATVSLHAYLSNLRRCLEPGRPPRTPAAALVTAPPGYALRLPGDAVDAWRFEAWVGRARSAPAEEARALLAEALGWWRGPAFAGHADEPWAATEVARLDGLRAEARERAVAADLATGRAAQAVHDAQGLVEAGPLREEGWRLLALAQWACGRQADALASLRRAAAVLRDEIGCDPGPALRDLEQAVLTGRLDVLRGAAPEPATAPRATLTSRPATPPAALASPAAPPEGVVVPPATAPAGLAVPPAAMSAGVVVQPVIPPAALVVPPAATPTGVVVPPAATPTGVVVPPATPTAALAVPPAAPSAAPAVPPATPLAGVVGSPAAVPAGVVVPSATAPAGVVVPSATAPAGLAVPAAVPSAGLVVQPAVPPGARPAAAPARVAPPAAGPGLFVGRGAELSALEAAARAAGPRGGLVLVTGEAGAGKSAFLGQAAAGLTRAGWRVVIGRCPEYEGAPPAWAWVEALGALAREVPPAAPDELAVLLRESDGTTVPAGAEAAAGRFRMHRAFSAWLRTAAAVAPLAVVLEDVHRADAETLALVEAAAAVTGVPLLTVAAYRPSDVDDHLLKTLAQLAPLAPHRITLGGLAPQDTATLVEAVCGGPVDPATVAALAERTGGNPFYVRESARLLADEGALVAISEVPQGVRDVLRRRLALLPAAARAVVQLAAVLGLEAEAGLLVDASDGAEEEVLDGLDAALAAGLLAEPGPGRVRFVHALVRDTVYADLSGVRRARLHARVARLLRLHRPGELAALAHHFARSGSPDDAPLAVDYALRAAEAAERRYAHDVAVTLIQQAIDTHTAAAREDTPPDRLIQLLVRLLGAQVRTGATDAARRTRRRAVELAEQADRGDLVAAVYGAWTEPTPWRSRLDGPYDRITLARLERLSTAGELDGPTRARVLQVLVDAVAGEDAPRALEAARDQLALARADGEPRLMAAALMTSARLLPHEAHAEVRPPLTEELRRLAHAHDLPAYRWVCEHLDAMTAAARNDPAAVRRHTAEGLVLARRYRLVWAQGLGAATSAMLAAVSGRFDVAEAGYAEADGLLQRVGAHHATGLRTLGLISMRLLQGRTADIEPMVHAVYESAGDSVSVARALVLARLGRLDEARTVPVPPEPVRDHLYGLELDFRAQLAVLVGDHASAVRLTGHLEPLRDQLAGAAGAAYASRPLAHALADLHRFLGEHQRAADAYALAERTARAWGSAHLAEDAARAAAGLSAERGRRRVVQGLAFPG
ncbi:BTAD domain-containing putative transcriptional regulator [Streptomyces sp. NPDC026665]|uniref:BTAD domain-containing putative transcriptional regulator n=1 Tax=Streptomyces sp. NPDC026665 TaxID=3154798 RepID=UPI00341021B8